MSDPIAKLEITRPGAMTPEGRAEVAAWLRRQASQLLEQGGEYTETSAYRARLFSGFRPQLAALRRGRKTSSRN